MKCRAGWCTSWNELCAGIVCLVAQLCLTLCNPWSGAHQAFCPWGFSRQEWSGLPCPPSGDLPNPGIEPRFPGQAESLPSEPPGNEDFWEKYQQLLICRWYYPNGRKQRGTKKPLGESEKREWKSCLKTQHSENKDHGVWSHHLMANRWGDSGNSGRFCFLGLQIYFRHSLRPWN